MSSGITGRFFGQLAFLLRQKLSILDALDLMAPSLDALGRIRDRIARGELLSTALAEFPPPFAKEVVPFVAEAENEGLLEEEIDILPAWSDEAETRPSFLAARAFAEASLQVRRGRTIVEAFRKASRPSDPGELRDAIRDLSKAEFLSESLSDAAGRHPRVFGSVVPRLLQQMERNGNAATAFADIARALSRGWFQPPASDPC